MILAKVLVGKTHVQKERNTSLCRPPDDRIVQAAGDGLYDSVMGERREAWVLLVVVWVNRL